jgi:hypothetical protein
MERADVGWWGRVLEGYVVLYFGSATFKVVRLLFIAVLCVHLFACLFYRVKKDGAESQEDIDHFYYSHSINPTVRRAWN